MRGKLNSTQTSLLYALPALEHCTGEDCKEVREMLEEILLSGEEREDSFLSDIFPSMVVRRDAYSELMGIKDKLEATQRYWREGHNRDVTKDCMVSFGEVKKIEDKMIKGELMRFAVYSEDNKRVLVPDYHSDLQVGDKISIHKGKVSEILPEEEYEKYA